MQILEEFKTIIKKDLKIGREETEKHDKNDDQSDSESSSSDINNFDIYGVGQSNQVTQKTKERNQLMKTFGLNVDVFYHTLLQLRETAELYEKEMTQQVGMFFGDIEQVNAEVTNLFYYPFARTNLNISNEVYELYEQKEEITAELFLVLNRYLRQWRLHLMPEFFNRVFLPQLTQFMSDAIISGLLSKQQNNNKSDISSLKGN